MLRCPFCHKTIHHKWLRGQKKVRVFCPSCGKLDKVVDGQLVPCKACGHVSPQVPAKTLNKKAQFWVCLICGAITSPPEDGQANS